MRDVVVTLRREPGTNPPLWYCEVASDGGGLLMKIAYAPFTAALAALREVINDLEARADVRL